MIGNVWEWTTDFYVASHKQQHSCCMPLNPRGPHAEDSYDPCQPQSKIPRKVIKGGSHLCAPNYCRRADRHLDLPSRLPLYQTGNWERRVRRRAVFFAATRIRPTAVVTTPPSSCSVI